MKILASAKGERIGQCLTIRQIAKNIPYSVCKCVNNLQYCQNKSQNAEKDMKLETYKLEMGESGRIYEFVSNGPNGDIQMRVIFTEMEIGGIYNLGFGDVDQRTNRINDKSRPANSDSEKVLATVVQTIVIFTTLYPNAIIFAKGSTESRTRLYQMGISKHLEDISVNFQVYGLVNGAWETFQRDQRYVAFLAERK